MPFTRKLISSFRGKVRVYGDDIIVPVDMMEPVAAGLEAFGLRVNSSKSFGTGRFRESCGGDYYEGVWITPVRVRSLFPRQLTQVTEIVSTVSLRNQLWETQLYPQAVAWLDEWLGRVLPHYPEVEPSSSALGRHTWNPLGEYMCSQLQVPLVKGLVVKSILPVSKLDGMGALVKYFLKRGETPFGEEDHLIRAGRPVSVDIKTRKAPLR